MRLEISLFGVPLINIGTDPEAPNRVALLACAKFHDGVVSGMLVPVSNEEEKGVSEWAEQQAKKHQAWAEELRKAAHYVQ